MKTKQTTSQPLIPRLRVGAAFLAGSLLMSQAQASDITLNYAFFAPAQTFPAVQMEHWAEELERRTDGRVSVNTFPGGTLLTAENMYDGVKYGVADIGLSITLYEPARFSLLNLAGSLTGVNVSAEMSSQVVYDLIEEFPDNALGLDEFKVITAFTSESGYLQTREPVRSLEDLSGLEIRVPGDSADVIRALGAVPVSMNHADTAEALQTGLVDGNVSSREVLKDMQLARDVKYVTDYALTNVVFLAVMNKERWNSLPDDVKNIIEELGAEMPRFAGEYLDSHVGYVMEWAEKEQGLEVVHLREDERDRWKKRLTPVNKELIGKAEDQGLPAKEFYNRQLELIEYYQTLSEES